MEFSHAPPPQLPTFCPFLEVSLPSSLQFLIMCIPLLFHLSWWSPLVTSPQIHINTFICMYIIYTLIYIICVNKLPYHLNSSFYMWRKTYGVCLWVCYIFKYNNSLVYLFSCKHHDFIFLHCRMKFRCVYVAYFFIYPFVDRHLDWFRLLAIFDKDNRNTCCKGGSLQQRVLGKHVKDWNSYLSFCTKINLKLMYKIQDPGVRRGKHRENVSRHRQ